MSESIASIGDMLRSQREVIGRLEGRVEELEVRVQELEMEREMRVRVEELRVRIEGLEMEREEGRTRNGE